MKSLFLDITGSINEKKVYNFLNEKLGEDFRYQLDLFLRKYITHKYESLTILNEKRLYGVLCFDNLTKRFVLFKISQEFKTHETQIIKFELLEFLKKNFKHIVIDNNDKFNNCDITNEINLELTKLIVFSLKFDYNEIEFFPPNIHQVHTTNGIELWKMIPFENKTIYLEQINKKDFEDELKINEEEYFNQFDRTKKLFEKYKLFTEYLRFNFSCKLEVFSNTIFEEEIKKGRTLSELDIDWYDESLIIEDTEVLIVDVKTQGLDFNLRFILQIKESFIEVHSFLETWKMVSKRSYNCLGNNRKFIDPYYINKFTITKDLSYKDIDFFLSNIFDEFKLLEKEYLKIYSDFNESYSKFKNNNLDDNQTL